MKYLYYYYANGALILKYKDDFGTPPLCLFVGVFYLSIRTPNVRFKKLIAILLFFHRLTKMKTAPTKKTPLWNLPVGAIYLN